ncbi:MAG: TIGR00153 family protein [Pseudomonadales bacterium]|nr:TIGR00153 family protein [Pseudomonadales bacterium]
MPNSPIFPKLFGRSPFTPIQEHMKVASKAASELLGFMDRVLEGDWENAKKFADNIVKLESDADAIKREIRQNLPRSLFLPVSRSDLLELLHMQDKIPNIAKDIVGLTMGRRMRFPPELAGSTKEYIEHSVGATNLALQALNELDELIVTGFSGREVDIISGMVKRLDEAEHDTDLRQIEVRNLLFGLEKDLNPVDVMFLYRIIDWIGDIADYSQTVGNRLLYLIAK